VDLLERVDSRNSIDWKLHNLTLNRMGQVGVYWCAPANESGTLPLRVPQRSASK
jgi:hypothetical protein